jgi:hypothetical protein
MEEGEWREAMDDYRRIVRSPTYPAFDLPVGFVQQSLLVAESGVEYHNHPRRSVYSCRSGTWTVVQSVEALVWVLRMLLGQPWPGAPVGRMTRMVGVDPNG